MTEYQEKQWNIFICNVSFSLFNFTQASSSSLPLILHSLHIVWSNLNAVHLILASLKSLGVPKWLSPASGHWLY